MKTNDAMLFGTRKWNKFGKIAKNQAGVYTFWCSLLWEKFKQRCQSQLTLSLIYYNDLATRQRRCFIDPTHHL